MPYVLCLGWGKLPGMELLGFVSRVVLVGVFALAGVSKLRDRAGTARALEDFGLPRGFAQSGWWTLPAAELGIAILLILPTTVRFGGIAALLLLLAFIGAIAVNLSKGNRVDCHCFGEVHSAPIGARTVIRNVVLALLALFVVLEGTASAQEAFAWTDGFGGFDTSLLVAGLGIAAVLFLTVWRRTAPEETHDHEHSPTALAEGDAAPSFVLPSVEGRDVTLAGLVKRNKPTILVFTDPGCGPCNTLMPDVTNWQRAYDHAVTVAVVASGDPEANRAKATENGLTIYLVQQERAVARSYGVEATPTAVTIDEEGRVASAPAVGPDEIRRLFEGAMARHVSHLWAAATGEEMDLEAQRGLALGNEVPDVFVKDLDGKDVRVRDLIQGETVMVFWSPGCGFCADMIDDLKELERAGSRVRRMLLISDGDPEANSAMGLRSPIVLDEGFGIGTALGVVGTPGAVIVNGDGETISTVAIGAHGVVQLVREGSGLSTAGDRS